MIVIRNTQKFSLLLGACVVIALPAFGQDAAPLRGEMFLAGKTPVDPPPKEPKNSHAYVSISGPAAVRIYRAMRGKEEKDLCQEGRKIKQVGKLSCSLAGNGKDATCDFSLDLIKGALDDGRPC